LEKGWIETERVDDLTFPKKEESEGERKKGGLLARKKLKNPRGKILLKKMKRKGTPYHLVFTLARATTPTE